MRICILHPKLVASGGAERKILLLFQELVEKGYDVTFVTHELNKTAVRFSTLSDQVCVWPYRYGKPVDFFVWAARLRKFDVIVASNYPANVVGVLSKIFGRRKLIWICNEIAVTLIRRNSLVWKLYYQIEKLLMKCVNKTIVNSAYTQQCFSSYYGMPSTVIYSGVDVDRLNKNHNILAEASKFDYLFCLSRIEFHKNIEFLSDICNYLKLNHPNLKIVLAGMGDAQNYVAELAATYGNLCYVGSVSEVEKAKYYVNAKAFLFLPHNEPLGVTIMESLAFGVPVVAFNSGGPLEIIGDDEILGRCCDSKEKYLKAINEVVTDAMKGASEVQYRKNHIIMKFSQNAMLNGFVGQILS